MRTQETPARQGRARAIVRLELGELRGVVGVLTREQGRRAPGSSRFPQRASRRPAVKITRHSRLSSWKPIHANAWKMGRGDSPQSVSRANPCERMDRRWFRTRGADRVLKTMRSHGSKTSGGRAAAALGRAVRGQRQALGLDQLMLCDLAGVGPAFLYSLEHGKPTVRLDKVVAVLEVLGLELHVRLGREVVSVDGRLRGDGK